MPDETEAKILTTFLMVHARMTMMIDINGIIVKIPVM